MEEVIRKFIKNICLKKGDRVRITDGRFAGSEGTILAIGKLLIVRLPLSPKDLFVVVSRDEIELV